jgi:hypothetical protein
VSRDGFARRRVVFLLSLAATVIMILAVGAGGGLATLPGPGGGVCGGSAGGATASKTIDGVKANTTWCWDSAGNLTYLTWGLSQASTWGPYTSAGLDTDNTAGGLGQHTASKTFTANWVSGAVGNFCYQQNNYWIHVVGGSSTLDFVETGASGDCG